jgi:hypothetical protein
MVPLGYSPLREALVGVLIEIQNILVFRRLMSYFLEILSGDEVSEGRSRGTARGAPWRGTGRGRGSRCRRRLRAASVVGEGAGGSDSLDGGEEAGFGPSPLSANRRLWPGVAACQEPESAKSVREEEDRAPECGSAATGASVSLLMLDSNSVISLTGFFVGTENL